MALRIEYMCPHCGWRFDALLARDGLVPTHTVGAVSPRGTTCPGSMQTPRNPESDRPRKSALQRLTELAAEPHPADAEGPEGEAWMPLRKSEAVELVSELDRLRVFENAMRAMAAQFLCPKTTAEEMARQVLGGDGK